MPSAYGNGTHPYSGCYGRFDQGCDRSPGHPIRANARLSTDRADEILYLVTINFHNLDRPKLKRLSIMGQNGGCAG